MKSNQPPVPPRRFPWIRTSLIVGGLAAGCIAFSRHHPELPWCRQVDGYTRPAVEQTCQVSEKAWDWAQTQWTEIANRPATPSTVQDRFGGRRDPALPPVTVYFTPTATGSPYAVNRMLCARIRSAAQSVICSYSDLDDDEVGAALLAAHQSGRTVQVGVDNRNCMRPAVQALIRAGVPVRTDRSVGVVDCNFLVIDEQVVCFGSLSPAFADLYRNNNHLLTIVDRGLARRFVEFFPVVYPVAGATGAATPATIGAAGAPTTAADTAILGIFSDDHDIQNRIVGQLAGAETSIDLIVPQLANDALIEGLLKARGRGVAVRICLDRGALLSAETKLLLENSQVELVRPVGSGRVRENVLVIDRRIVACVSGGWPALGAQPRRELALLINSSGLAAVFAAEFDRVAGSQPPAPDGYAFELARNHAVTVLYPAPPR